MFERTGTCYVSGQYQSVTDSYYDGVCFYCAGLAIGGVWGLAEGLRRPEGSTIRLRLNSVLNGCTRRGPFLANTGAVLGRDNKLVNVLVSCVCCSSSHVLAIGVNTS